MGARVTGRPVKVISLGLEYHSRGGERSVAEAVEELGIAIHWGSRVLWAVCQDAIVPNVEHVGNGDNLILFFQLFSDRKKGIDRLFARADAAPNPIYKL